MANYDRGVYEPSDEVRVFDGSEEDDDVEGSRLPLLIVLALLVLAMFGGVVWLAYTQGVARGRGETPVLTAAAGPDKVAPSQAGGAVPYQGLKIYEQPAPPDDSTDNAPPAPKAAQPEPVKPAPVAQAPVETPKPAPALVVPASKPAPMAMAPAPKAAPVVATPAPKVAAAPKPATPPPAAAKPAAKPTSVAALIQQANSTPPATRPAPVAAGPATGAPRALVPATKPATPPPAARAPAVAKPVASGGGIVLQIGAYKSQADADAAWASYKAKHAALLSGYSPDVKQADLGEKGTWYRLRVAGFSDREVASGLCDRLKADGGACILAK